MQRALVRLACHVTRGATSPCHVTMRHVTPWGQVGGPKGGREVRGACHVTVVEAVVEDEGGVGLRRDRDVKAREGGLACHVACQGVVRREGNGW